MPIREWASATATAVMASAPTRLTTSTVAPPPIPLYTPSASAQSSTIVSSRMPLRSALRTTPKI